MKAPCKDCPFRKDVRFYLGEPRAREIANKVILGDSSFPCHKTVCANTPRDFSKETACVGALLSIQKERGTATANLWVRLGVMCGAINIDSLDQSVPVRNAQEFIEDLS